MKTAYTYLTDPQSGRIITVARALQGNRAYFGIAVCHPRDRHKKATGRMIAEGRMKKHPDWSYVTIVDGEHPMRTIARALVLGNYPSYVSRAAREFLHAEKPKRANPISIG